MIRQSIADNKEFKIVLQKIQLTKIKIRDLTFRKQNSGGRGSSGQIIAPRRGAFIRRIYRCIDFKRINMLNHTAVYLRTVYDPNRTAALGLICYPIGIMSYILKPMKINPGDFINNMVPFNVFYGDAVKLANFSSGLLIYNIDGKYTRSAGCSSILIRKDSGQALLKLKSGELRYFNQELIATSGTVSNENHFLRNYKKAGIIRYLGKRPRTRPSSMNPVDHPMGGRTRGGSFPTNRKGLLTLNRPTVKTRNKSVIYTKRQLKLLKFS